MLTANHITFKKRLHQHCIQLIEQRIATTLAIIDNARDAANSEEKSSAGDKYETGRAMGHLDQEMHGKQLAANRKELAALLNIDCSVTNNKVTTGSFIKCPAHSFFIAAGLGKIQFEGETIFVLSPLAPLAVTLLHKKAGDSIAFNNNTAVILEVF